MSVDPPPAPQYLSHVSSFSHPLISITIPHLGQTQQKAEGTKKEKEWMGGGAVCTKKNIQDTCMCLVHITRCMDINGYYFYYFLLFRILKSNLQKKKSQISHI